MTLKTMCLTYSGIRLISDASGVQLEGPERQLGYCGEAKVPDDNPEARRPARHLELQFELASTTSITCTPTFYLARSFLRQAGYNIELVLNSYFDFQRSLTLVSS